MSAFIIEDVLYIKLLASLLQSKDWQYYPTKLNRISFVKGLRAWNYKSVNHRYKEESKEPAFALPDLDTLRMIKPFNDAELYKTLACINYQSCEVEDWYNSEEEILLTRIQKDLASTFIEKTSAYDSAKWGSI